MKKRFIGQASLVRQATIDSITPTWAVSTEKLICANVQVP